MKTFRYYLSALVLCLFTVTQSFSQDWHTNGNIVIPGEFLGSQNNLAVDFRTNYKLRMRLMETSTTTVDGYSIDNSGFLGLSMDPNWFAHEEPYSLLHLNGEFNIPSGFPSQQFGYRDWMRPGINFTDNGDLMYIGPKANGFDDRQLTSS